MAACRACKWERCREVTAAAPFARRSSFGALLTSALRVVTGGTAGRPSATPRLAELAADAQRIETVRPPSHTAAELQRIRRKALVNRTADARNALSSSEPADVVASAASQSDPGGAAGRSAHARDTIAAKTAALKHAAKEAAEARRAERGACAAQQACRSGGRMPAQVGTWRSLFRASASTTRVQFAPGSARQSRLWSLVGQTQAEASQASVQAAAAQAEAVLRRALRAERDVRSGTCMRAFWKWRACVWLRGVGTRYTCLLVPAVSLHAGPRPEGTHCTAQRRLCLQVAACLPGGVRAALRTAASERDAGNAGDAEAPSRLWRSRGARAGGRPSRVAPFAAGTRESAGAGPHADQIDVDPEGLPPAVRTLVQACVPDSRGAEVLRSAEFWRSAALPTVLEACTVSALHTFGEPGSGASNALHGPAGAREQPAGREASRHEGLAADWSQARRIVERCADASRRLATSTHRCADACGVQSGRIAAWLRRRTQHVAALSGESSGSSREQAPWSRP